MFSLFGSSHHSLSPLARRGLRCLLPLCALAMVALAFAVGTSLFVRDPEQARLAAARASYEEARRTQASQQTARKAQEDLSALWQLLPARTEFPELVLTVSEVAREDHVVIPGINYVFDKVDGGLALKATMTFRSAGEYSAIRRFIHRLETKGPYLFIESLDASRSTEGKDTTNGGNARPVTPVVFNLRVVSFLRPHTDHSKGET